MLSLWIFKLAEVIFPRFLKIQHMCKVLQQTQLQSQSNRTRRVWHHCLVANKNLPHLLVHDLTLMPPPLHSRGFYHDNSNNRSAFPGWAVFVIFISIIIFVIITLFIRARVVRNRIQADATIPHSSLFRSNDRLESAPPPYPGHAGNNPTLYGYSIPVLSTQTCDLSTTNGGTGSDPGSGQTFGGTGGGFDSGGGFSSSGGVSGCDSSGGGGGVTS
ncbi:hypothetical protein DL96DRAFT_1623458 [Flagelloscypha sp. PMI_526]|nr:hypothetical protein DL96DRAFT_1623458 [Flagelloscypha sp. PMI_526]